MAEGKGHTELPWMAASAYSSVCGVPIVNRQGRRIANTALPNMPKEWDELKQQAVIDAAFICTAVNTYPHVEGLVKALELLLHVRGTSEDTPGVRDQAESALTRFRSLQNGGAN